MKKTTTILTLLAFFTINSYGQKVENIIEKAIENMSINNSYKYTFNSLERIEGGMILSTMETKLMQDPHKIYIKNISGKNKGKELLYVRGENKNKVLVNVAWGLSLNPFNPLLRKGNHYTILQVGFKRINKILKSANKTVKRQNNIDEIFSYEGMVEYNNKTCYKVIITDPHFKYVDYTIQNDESLYDIAKRENVSEQLIIEMNKNLNGFDSAKEGLKIKIPTSYAKKTILYLDKDNYHAIYQEMHDEKGLYEKYQFLNMTINPSFSSSEFHEEYKEYDF